MQSINTLPGTYHIQLQQLLPVAFTEVAFVGDTDGEQ